MESEQFDFQYRTTCKHLFHLGEQVTVQLDLEKVFLFDVETEKVIR